MATTQEEAINAGVRPRSRGWLRKIGLGLLIAIGVVAVGLGAAHVIWKSSGSGQWVLFKSDKGVTVYTLKEPGSTLVKVRGLTRVKSTLNHAVAYMMDSSLQNCREMIDICAASVAVEPWNPQKLYYIQLYQENFPAPFGPHEFLLKTQFAQDPRTKAVEAAFIAVPDRLPPHDCCKRIEHMHNVWTFTPVGADELDVRLLQDMDIGIPYFLYNRDAAEGVLDTLADIATYFNKDKYKDANWDFIQSP
jgi:hypothetical protein